MKKNMIICLSIIILIVLTFGLVAIAANNHWGIFKKEIGIISSQQGILISAPTEKDKKDIIASFDPKTGHPIKRLEYKVLNDEKELKKIRFNHDGKDTELTFGYVKRGDKNIIIYEPGEEQYLVTPIPKNSKNLIEFNNSIYLLDIDNSSISKFLKDEAGEYDIKTALKDDIEGFEPTWGTKPSINSSGTKMIFHSTRNAIKDNNLTGEIWVKDLVTGDEKRLCEGGYSALGWDTGNNVYLKQGDSIIKLNAIEGKIQVIKELVVDAAFAYPYLIYQYEDGNVKIIDLENSKETVFRHDAVDHISFFRVNIDASSPWVAMLNYPGRKSTNASLVFLNMKTLEITELSAPTNSSIVDCSWMDVDNLLVNVWDKGARSEITYTVAIK